MGFRELITLSSNYYSRLFSTLLILALAYGFFPEAIFGSFSEGPATLKSVPLVLLRSVGQIHALTREQAKRGYPVHIHGVVTFFYRFPKQVVPGTEMLGTNMFIQDASGGNWVDLAGNDQPDLKAGDFI